MSRPLVKSIPLVLALALPALAGAQARMVTICHYTGDPAAPYQTLELTPAEADQHLDHPNDIIPAPRAGCPTASQVTPVPTAAASPRPAPRPGVTAVPTGSGSVSPAYPLPRATRTPRRDRLPTPTPARTAAPVLGVRPATELRRPRSPSRTAVTRSGGRTAGSLPATGGEPPLTAMLGLSLLLGGLGVRLRYCS